MNIYEIKEKTKETEPYFFSKETLHFFGQILSDFTVKKQSDGRYRIKGICRNAPLKHYTIRFFNPINNKLEFK